MTATTINLHEPVFEILKRLGLDDDATSVLELNMNPTQVHAKVALRNEDDRKYVDPETGEVAHTIVAFDVTTVAP